MNRPYAAPDDRPGDHLPDPERPVLLELGPELEHAGLRLRALGGGEEAREAICLGLCWWWSQRCSRRRPWRLLLLLHLGEEAVAA